MANADRDHLLDLNKDGTRKYSEYFNASDEKRKILEQVYTDEVLTARYEQKRSGMGF